jgi:hypothetical protein
MVTMHNLVPNIQGDSKRTHQLLAVVQNRVRRTLKNCFFPQLQLKVTKKHQENICIIFFTFL